MRVAIVNIVILMFSVTLTSACAPNYGHLASESIKQERFEEAVGYLKECSNQGDEGRRATQFAIRCIDVRPQAASSNVEDEA